MDELGKWWSRWVSGVGGSQTRPKQSHNRPNCIQPPPPIAPKEVVGGGKELQRLIKKGKSGCEAGTFAGIADNLVKARSFLPQSILTFRPGRSQLQHLSCLFHW